MKIGIVLPQLDSDPDTLRRTVSEAKESGIDSIWVADHLMGRDDPSRPILEGWTSLVAVAAETDLQVGTLVLRAGLRASRLVAEMFATLSSIATGGVVAGIGIGDNGVIREQSSYGIAFPPRAERIAETRQTMESMVRHAPGVKIWIGGRSPEAMSLAAEAGGWNLWGPPQEFVPALNSLKEAAGGRSVETSWGGSFPGDKALDALRDAGADHAIVAVGTGNFSDRIASLKRWARG